jgi:AcrR family transcriptional regulator
MKRKLEYFLEERKTDIVTAVLRLADRFGIRGITTKRIAEEVGFVEGALYKHIRSKGEIFSTILDVSEMLIKDQFQQIEALNLKADAALRQWLLFAVTYLEEFPGVYRILFSDELYNENKNLFYKFKDITIFLRETFEAIIRRGIKDRIFRKELNPEVASVLYLGVVHTAFTMWNLLEERKKKFQELATPIFDEFLKTLLTEVS